MKNIVTVHYGIDLYEKFMNKYQQRFIELNKKLTDFNDEIAALKDKYWKRIHATSYFRYLDGKEHETLRRLLCPRSGERLLDVGCLFGEKMKDILNNNAVRFIGIDISRYAIYQAKKNIFKGHFLIADAHKLPFRNNIFDKILASHIVEHLELRFFNEVKKILKSGGIIVVITPHTPRIAKLQHFITRVLNQLLYLTARQVKNEIPLLKYKKLYKLILDKYELKEHTHEFTIYELENIFKKTGFSIEKKQGWGIPFLFGELPYYSEKISFVLMGLAKMIEKTLFKDELCLTFAIKAKKF